MGQFLNHRTKADPLGVARTPGLCAGRVKIEADEGRWEVSIFTGVTFEVVAYVADRYTADRLAEGLVAGLREAVLCDRNFICSRGPRNERRRSQETRL